MAGNTDDITTAADRFIESLTHTNNGKEHN